MRMLTAIALLIGLLCSGCGNTLIMRIPELPFRQDDAAGTDAETDLRVECEFMTVLIDYSRHGMGLAPADVHIASRVAKAMANEFESRGTRVTDSRNDAYWSLMILAANNEQHDGYIFSALLASRNMSEGHDPGVTMYAGDLEGDAELGERIAIPSMYNGLSYGPYESLEGQAREYVRQAYAAVFPAAKQLCDFAEADQNREREIEAQLPGLPKPL